MTRDAEVLRVYILVIVTMASIGTTSIPVIYAFSAWRSSPLGRAYMVKAITFAVTMDLTLLFMFWRPSNIMIRFWINAILLTAVAMTSAWMAWNIWRIGHPNRKKVEIVQFSTPVYDVLKKVAQLWLPGAGTLYFTLAQIWGLPAAEEVVGTVMAVDTFLGILLGLSSASYERSGDKFDGTLIVEPGEEGSQLRLKSVNVAALESQDELTFRVVQGPQ